MNDLTLNWCNHGDTEREILLSGEKRLVCFECRGLVWWGRQREEIVNESFRLVAITGTRSAVGLLSSGYRGQFPEVKRPGREAGNLPAYSTKVNIVLKYISTFPYVFIEYCLIKHRDNFTFTCYKCSEGPTYLCGKKNEFTASNLTPTRNFKLGSAVHWK
jgi:hypothetical protein